MLETQETPATKAQHDAAVRLVMDTLGAKVIAETGPERRARVQAHPRTILERLGVERHEGLKPCEFCGQLTIWSTGKDTPVHERCAVSAYREWEAQDDA